MKSGYSPGQGLQSRGYALSYCHNIAVSSSLIGIPPGVSSIRAFVQ
jgi:hypothetical protein